jgi:hypothetical protein
MTIIAYDDGPIERFALRFPFEVKGRGPIPLFYRFYLKKQPEGDGPTKTIGVYLHCFIRSDPDELHSHPWRWGMAVCLKGGYVEEREHRDGSVRRRRVRPGSVVFLTSKTRHRVILADGARSWSFFIAGPRIARWVIGDRVQ